MKNALIFKISARAVCFAFFDGDKILVNVAESAYEWDFQSAPRSLYNWNVIGFTTPSVIGVERLLPTVA